VGQSTDAILCYGIPLEEDYDFDEAFSGKIKDEDLEEDYISGWTASEYLEKETDCVLISHCSCDYPMFILSVEESKIRAWRGDPKEVTSLDVKPEWNEKIQKVADLMGLSGKPGWWLASDWC
jgi:hypothetical protein